MIISNPDFRLEPLVLPGEEVHLWRVDLAAVADGELRWLKILSPDEQTKAARFRFARDRRRFASTRAVLRTVLGAYLGSEPEKIIFRYAGKGKPFLKPRNSAESIDFNVSHSGDVALLVFARGRPVGVDVEQIRDNLDPLAIARRYFSTHEQSQLAAFGPGERCAAFFRCWTRKEAYIKARGDGLSLPLDSFDVSLEARKQNALLGCRTDDTDITLWPLEDIEVGKGYASALCVRGHGWKLKS